jgi:hypothetical protein
MGQIYLAPRMLRLAEAKELADGAHEPVL